MDLINVSVPHLNVYQIMFQYFLYSLLLLVGVM